MIGYRQRTIKEAFNMLQRLRRNVDDTHTLLTLQELLVREIMRAENRIKFYKAEIRETTPHRTNRRSAWLNTRIGSLRYLNWIWRCFGDAIAFSYLDKHALKHVYYDTRTVEPKQDAGFLLGKPGLDTELEVLKALLEQGVPAVLSDLTNTIRHGDVTVLLGPDPFPIEVKSGRNLNPRGKRQLKQLRQIHEFFRTDRAEGLRGLGPIVRVEHPAPEIGYADQLNACIEQAMRMGWADATPEKGLRYLAITDLRENIDTLMKASVTGRSWVFLLNAHKSAMQWEPYTPFLLTITNFDNLISFIRGSLILIVIIDLDAFGSVMSEFGLRANFDDDLKADYPLKFTYENGTDPGALSAHFLQRIAFEFISPRWVAEYAAETYLRNRNNSFVEQDT